MENGDLRAVTTHDICTVKNTLPHILPRNSPSHSSVHACIPLSMQYWATMTGTPFYRLTMSDGITNDMRNYLLDHMGLGGENWKRVGWDCVEVKINEEGLEFFLRFRDAIAKHKEIVR